MDPYLENPDLWPGFHNRFIVYLADALRDLIRPRYVAAVEGRVYIQESHGQFFVPDNSVRRNPAAPTGPTAVATLVPEPFVDVSAEPWEVNESFIHILDRGNQLAVVSVIELVSPTNKAAGKGRREYRRKQRAVLRSNAHLVEVDLLRRGKHTVAVPPELSDRARPFASLVSVCPMARPRHRFRLYPRTLRQRLPIVRIPLAAGDEDVAVDLQMTLDRAYESGDYQLIVRYDRPCFPPLSPGDQAWADGLIRAAPPTT